MNKGGLAIFGGAMALYGIFSVGYGIYTLINDKKNDKS